MKRKYTLTKNEHKTFKRFFKKHREICDWRRGKRIKVKEVNNND